MGQEASHFSLLCGFMTRSAKMSHLKWASWIFRQNRDYLLIQEMAELVLQGVAFRPVDYLPWTSHGYDRIPRKVPSI